jgi:rubredoxin
MKFRCTVCDFVYDEQEQDLPFAQLPDDYECPVCGAAKDVFVEEA